MDASVTLNASILLREMEAKARANVIDMLVPTGNTLTGRVLHEKAVMEMAEHTLVLFELNGVKHAAKATIADFECRSLPPVGLQELLFKRVSEAITVELLRHFEHGPRPEGSRLY